MNYSVLMSVYKKEKPEYLKIAIESILNQSVQTDDFVIIEDGLLTEQLENIIKNYEEKNDNINVIRRINNRGLGISLQEGVLACKNDIIARMDSDDYSLPQRCEKQIKVIEEGKDIVGTNIDEFKNDIDNIVSTKKMPKSKEEIYKYAKYRNPFNHPTVMYRKEAVLNAGNYNDLYRLEDYELWIRMLSKDVECCNIQESLVRMRVNKEFYARRGGKDNLKSHLKLKKIMRKNNQISTAEYIIGCMIMTFRAYCPGRIKGFLYKIILRK